MSDFPSDEAMKGWPTQTINTSNTWPNTAPALPAISYRPSPHCPTCHCGCNHYPYYTPYDPYYRPWNQPWMIYTTNR